MKKNDTIKPRETPNIGPPHTSDDPNLVRQEALAEEIMHDDRGVLQALAK